MHRRQEQDGRERNKTLGAELTGPRVFHIMDDQIEYLNVSQVAKRWGCGADKASCVLDKWRGKIGFMDIGWSARRNRRRHAIIRVHPALLKEIEASL
jgi:hypothetical protein